MRITKKELNQEIAILKSFGLTSEEFKGMMEFFDYTVEVERSASKKIRLLNSKGKRRGLK